MLDKADAKNILTASPQLRRPLERPCPAWLTTIQQDLISNNLSLNEAIGS